MFERLQFKNREFSFCKNPEKYDEYVCTLSPKYLEIAKRELNETDEVRKECLQEMREWIANNPNIISCRTDALFLMRFLRVCKFKVPAACEKLENFLKTRQKFPKWFKNVSVDDDCVRELFEAGYVIPLPEKDKLGRQVLFFQTKNLDHKKYTSCDLVRMFEVLTQLFYDDEEIQVTGMLCIFDDTDFRMGHILMWSLSDIRNAVKFISRSTPIRSCGWYRINFPTFGRAIFEFVRTLMKQKIRHRVQVRDSK